MATCAGKARARVVRVGAAVHLEGGREGQRPLAEADQRVAARLGGAELVARGERVPVGALDQRRHRRDVRVVRHVRGGGAPRGRRALGRVVAVVPRRRRDLLAQVEAVVEVAEPHAVVRGQRRVHQPAADPAACGRAHHRRDNSADIPQKHAKKNGQSCNQNCSGYGKRKINFKKRSN